MNKNTFESDVPDLLLERFRLGESEPQEAAWIERLLEADEVLRARLDALRTSDREILAQHPPSVVGTRLRALVERSSDSRVDARRLWLPRLLPVAALLVLAIGIPIVLSLSGAQPDADGRAKGAEASLLVFRKTASGAERLAPLSPVSAGDRLRLGYRARDPRYGVIVSVDGNGKVSQHFPDDGPDAARLETDGVVLLDFALELDAVPGLERFFLVTSATPFRTEIVRRAAEVLATGSAADPDEKLNLPSDLSQVVLALRKE